MATQAAYRPYKRETSRLVKWIIERFRGLSKCCERATPKSQDLSARITATGEVKACMIPEMCQFIALATRVDSVPSNIFTLFEYVIRARKKANRFWKEFFIDVLEQAFETLGGSVWREECWASILSIGNNNPGRTTLKNRFAPLDPYGNTEPGHTDKEESMAGTKDFRQLTTKGGKARKPKLAGGPRPAIVDSPEVEYRLVMDDGSAEPDIGYLVDIIGLIKTWINQRAIIQKAWHDCAFHKKNTVVAATISGLGTADVVRDSSAISVIFGARGSYATFLKELTGLEPSDSSAIIPEGAAAAITAGIGLDQDILTPEDGRGTKGESSAIDIKEQLMMHMYGHLHEFFTDYRKNRSGKPTKRMSASISSWDSNLDLTAATMEQRMKWRRDYTILLLYALVEQFASVELRLSDAPKKPAADRIDWYTYRFKAQWDKERRLFALNEFAAWAITLATQDERQSIGDQVLAHHVFQLQCIVDSFMVTHGWFVDSFGAHVLSVPAMDFDCGHEARRFLSSKGPGFIAGVDLVLPYLDLQDNTPAWEMLTALRHNFVNRLGSPAHSAAPEDASIPNFAARDKSTVFLNASPFFCGDGLLEAVDIAHLAGMQVLWSVGHITVIVHIYNLLLKKNVLEKPIPLWEHLTQLVRVTVFSGGNPPRGSLTMRSGPVPQ
ncbi:hypothetical protein B0T21DRAFT_446223 [Apiosordaria backusii]|uniref:DUF6604 domain-containing protein n=1 Tax=Apiosordaria backusii TaxID=314023 RepID=A0AA40EXB9_9PEZI|nr:hypothetical protein B0T21DRAFT_446223 [Apiosordaria backusii]